MIHKAGQVLVCLTSLALAITGCHPPSLISATGANSNQRDGTVRTFPIGSRTGVRSISAVSNQVETIAGSTFGFRDGSGPNAQFKFPWAVVVDSNGTVYVADYLNSSVRMIGRDGQVNTLVGLGAFRTSNGIALLGNETVAVSCYSHIQTVYNNATSVYAGNKDQWTAGYKDGIGTDAQFASAAGIDADSNGNIFVADSGNQCVRKIAPGGIVSTFAGVVPEDRNQYGNSGGGFADGPARSAKFFSPTDVAVDRFGNVFVSDAGNNRIRKIDAFGNVSTLAGSTAGYSDGQGTASQFNNPCGIGVDGQGNVYVADSGNNRIRKINPSGVVTTVAGSGIAGYADGALSTSQFNFPKDVAVDTSGNLIVADPLNYKVRKISLGTNLALKVDTPFFSPNQDGTLDTATISIQASAPWKLSAVGQGLIATGSADVMLHWDGRLSGQGSPLSDGEYKLRLDPESGNTDQSKEDIISIDTVKPVLEKITIDDKAEHQITKNIIPVLKATISDATSKLESPKSVQLNFSRKSDDYSVRVYDNAKTYIQESGEFSYQVPFEEDGFLYPGDQWVEVSARDRAGNQTSKKFWFAVGTHNMSSGIPGKNDPRPASIVQRTGTYGTNTSAPVTRPLKTYRLPQQFNNPSYKVRRFSPDRAEFGLRPAAAGAAATPAYYGYVVLGATVAGVATWVFFDEAYDNLEKFLDREYAFVIDTEQGTYKLSKKKEKHIAPHSEIDADTLAEVVSSINKSDENIDLEAWRKTSEFNSPNVLFLFKKNGYLFQAHWELLTDGMSKFYNLDTAYGSGVYRNTGWPSLVQQWSNATYRVAKFYISNKIQQQKPQYPVHFFGEIPNKKDPVKPYNIINGTAQVIPGKSILPEF